LTLAEVLRSLQGELLRVARADDAGATAVADVTIYDPADPRSVHAGAIVLGVGLGDREGEAIALVDRAGRAGAAAIVLRVAGEPPQRLLEIAAGAGLAVLSVGTEVGWGHVYSLVRSALAGVGAAAEGEALGVRVGDLFALSDAIAAAIGGPVTIEDPQARVLAYSNLDQPIDDARRQTILGRMPPLDWQQRIEEAGVARHLRSGEGAIRFDAPGLSARLAAPVRAGGEMLGAVWVAAGAAPFGDEAAEELERLAPLAAVHLLAHRASEDIRRRTRGAFIREVLEGRGGEGMLRVDGPFTVMAFEVSAPDPASPSPERLLGVVSLYAEGLHRDAMCAFLDGRVWALVPGTARGRLAEAARLTVERVQRSLGVELHAGVGLSVPRLADVPRSRRSAEQALQVVARRPARGPVVMIEEVEAHAVMLELLDLAAGRPSLLAGRLSHLIEHDRDHGTEYVVTLRAYLDAACDIRRAGEALGLHPNSVRYRVRRLVEISGIDLLDPDERVVTELQLRLVRSDEAGA
jgi:GAF domain-containing protein